jgi:hypothetical protein
MTQRSRSFGAFIVKLKFGVVLLSSLLNSFVSPASPLQHPKRIVNSYTVDLTSLFKWWSKHDGPRPLSSWVHITGSVVGTNGGVWILEAQVEGAGTKAQAGPADGTSDPGRGPIKVYLQNPPVDDLADFEELSGRLSALMAQRGQVAGEENQAKSQEQAVAQQQQVNRRNTAQARVLAEEDKHLKHIESTTKAQGTSLDQQIKELKTKLAIYPNTDHYEVDCFALDLQFDHNRLPVYDHGRVLK